VAEFPRADTQRAVGRVLKPHGVRGELLVEVRTDSPVERFAAGTLLRAVLPEGDERELTVGTARWHSGRLLVRFEEVDSRDGAGALRGTMLTADVVDLPPTTDPDEFYDHQLEGLAVHTVGGAVIGTVREVVHGPAGELLLVDRNGGEALVPFVRDIVPEVDLRRGHIVVNPPEGLLDP